MNTLPDFDGLRQRRQLHAEIAEYIGGLIIDGTLAPGTKIPERELCERLDVSRTPIREALKVLAADGLVRLAQNRGAWVSPLTAEDLEEAFPVMGALEALAGELAAARMTDAELAEVEALHAEMVACYGAGRLTDYFALNQRIHGAILAAARNPTLEAHYRPLAARLRRARFKANTTPDRWADAIAEHERIMAALRDRDGPRLGAILRDHLRGKYRSVISQLSDAPPPA
ncbi:MAG: GntR family transcriptional regulator [Alkalilacustris sp.]